MAGGIPVKLMRYFLLLTLPVLVAGCVAGNVGVAPDTIAPPTVENSLPQLTSTPVIPQEDVDTRRSWELDGKSENEDTR